jgi:hypothetical protein
VRFSNFRGVTKGVQSGFYFHPTDEDLSAGTPERKKPLEGRGFPLHQLENRYCGAEFLFPLTYICGDVFTEVYGYGASRRAIWLGFFATGLMGQLAVAPAPEWNGQESFARVFGLAPRFTVGSVAGYWVGEFTNSYTMAKLKLITRGRWLWTRTAGSTLSGQGRTGGQRHTVFLRQWRVPGRHT